MNSLELMQAADALTGCKPGMSPAEIRERLDSMTPDRQMAVYLCAEFKKTRDSAARSEMVTRLNTLAQGSAWVAAYVNRELTRRVSITRARSGGRPAKHASAEIARREASRAYRERRRAETR